MLSKRLDERVFKIDELIKVSSETKDLPFQQNNYKCPVIEIDSEFLIYRLGNTRTISKQKEYIANKKESTDFFSKERLEVAEVQDAQHDILVTEVDKELEQAYEMQAGQTDPILINKQGVVINGNRRLCLMRNNSQPLIKCQVVVDPNLDGKDSEIEAWIDIAPNATRPYIWHAVGLSMIELSNAGYSNDQIRKMKGIVTTTEAEVLMKATKLAEEQLIAQGIPDKWSTVDKSEQIFRDAAAKSIPNPVDKRVAELATIAINVATDDAVGERRYKPVSKVLKNPGVVREIFEAEAGIEAHEINSFTKETESKIKIDEDKIKKIIGDPAQVDIFVEKIIEKLDEDEQIKAGKGKRKLLQTKINAAAKALVAAQNLTDEGGYDVDGIKEKLDEMLESIKKVKDYIN